ncbi:MAG: hypothetical protein AB7Y46_07385 [Armatimonadota bacterium]
MRIISWLRDLVADFFSAGEEADSREAELIRGDLEKLRTLVLLAVAQARRTELELRELLAVAEPDARRVESLAQRLEEERGRARELVEQFRQREAEAAEHLSRLGQVRLAEEMNARREDLRRSLAEAGRARNEAELARLEDESRAEAYRLDVLERLDAGRQVREPPRAAARLTDAEIIAHAKALLDESENGEPLSER